MAQVLSSGALQAPSAARNREPILAVLRETLPVQGLVLEIASGTGEHAVHFAAALPGIRWQPTDRDADALRSIAAHRDEAGLQNLLPPLLLDAAAPDWSVARADAIVSVNMIHISPWATSEGLMAGARRLLPVGGVLVLYGPYREADVPSAPSNQAFDASLRGRNPEWGLRDRDEVASLAGRNELALSRRVAMPANNIMLVFRRTALS